MPWKGALALAGACSLCLVLPARGQTPTSPPSVKEAHEPIKLVDGAPRLPSGEKLAEVNVYCLGCHADLGAAPPSAAAHRLGDSARSHAAWGPYPKDDPDFVPARKLDKRFVLVGGRLTCIACHARDASDHGLVMSTEAGQLCLGCHRK
jgi:predicted CXXCH cytochrome family protein